MNAQKRKSKQRAATNSKPKRNEPVSYPDLNLGKHVIADEGPDVDTGQVFCNECDKIGPNSPSEIIFAFAKACNRMI